jgi:iron complex outermembrane recepter protein
MNRTKSFFAWRRRLLYPLLAIARIFFVLFLAFPAHAQQTGDLTEKSMEDLMNMQVTSVSKKQEKLSRTAAAVFVITAQDIRNSGATNIPDLLRMVPGLDVGQINANTWAISARGFNLQFANKLLVLIDGRAVYTPLFGGVYWDTQDVPLEDIDRIEVIRGPGAAVWGANAVNGVINVLTKNSAATRGALMSGGGGNQDAAFGTLQYGGSLTTDTTYRVFAKYQDHNNFPILPELGPNADAWHLLHGGFRADTNFSPANSLTIQGDLYSGSEGAAITHTLLEPPKNVTLLKLAQLSGGNLLGRWKHVFSSRSDVSVQLYFDHYTRSGPESRESRSTLDFDFEHHFLWGNRQDFVWGLGYRYTGDLTAGTIDQAWVPAGLSRSLFNSFVQDEILLKPDQLFLTLGTKLENDYFTGFDLEPSARLAWAITERQTVWGAVSNAERTPTRRDEDLVAALAALPGPEEVLLLGNTRLKPENLVAYEFGYRARSANRLYFDTGFFVNSYQDLETQDPSPPIRQSNPPLLILPLAFGNGMSGTTDGLEVSINWKTTNRWTLTPGYALLQMHLHASPVSGDTTTAADTQGTSPTHQAQLRSHVEISRGFAWDANAYFVDRLPAAVIASYTRLDSQLAWKLTESINLSFAGQNLLTDRHPEFNNELQSVNSSQIKRSVYIKFSWLFL